jgi:hypothetical protein
MDFYSKIKKQVSDIQSQFHYPNDGTAFGHFLIKECFNKIIDFEYDGSDFDDFVKEHIVDMSNDLGNDAIFTNLKNREILVFQFKYSNGQLLNTAEIKKNKAFVDWILGLNHEPLNPNSKLKKIIDDEISKILNTNGSEQNNFSITFHYIDFEFNQKIQTDIKALHTNFNEKGIIFNIKFYNYEELDALYNDVEIPNNNVTLKIIPKEHFIKKNNFFEDDKFTPIETIVTSIIANSLKPVIADKKELILALNVRYYKGENEINSKIKQEYSKGKKSNFWILNNGINAVCEDFKIDKDELKIKNFQIVNGGQTTKTLVKIINDLPDEVQMIMRLTKITDKKRTSKISKDIAVASNSQNAISSRDLHSGDRMQQTIFKYLNEVGIFYDKKDGEWVTISNKSIYRNPCGNHPMHLKIHNTELAVSYLSLYLQIPISTAGRHKIVFSEVYYDQIFDSSVNECDQFYKLMLSYRISERINKIKEQKAPNFEILQNNYINDVILSLSGIFFFKEHLDKVLTPMDLAEQMKSIKGLGFLDKNQKYAFKLENKFDEFVMGIIQKLQYILDLKKDVRRENGQEWLASDTSNWLKKDGTYKDIYDRVIKKLKEERS